MLASRHARGSPPSWSSADGKRPPSCHTSPRRLPRHGSGTNVQRKAVAPRARGTCLLLSWRLQALASQMPRFRVCTCRSSLGGLLGSITRGADALHLGVALLVHITAVAMKPVTTPSAASMAVRFFWCAVLPQALLACRTGHRASSGGVLLLYSTAVQQHCVVSSVFSLCIYEREVCVDRTVQGLCGPSTALLRGGPSIVRYRTIEVPKSCQEILTALLRDPALFTIALLLRDHDCTHFLRHRRTILWTIRGWTHVLSCDF